MLKTLMVTTAVAGLMIGSAMAEGVTPSPPAPASAAKPMTPAPAATTVAPAEKSGSMSRPAGSSSAQFINSQKPDQYLASKFKGTDVIGSDDQKIGDVSDMLFDKDGKIEAYVVSVGGFLGIGSKYVALAPSSFQVVPGDKSKNESDKLRLSMTKDQLKEAANFEPYKAPSSTTGSGAGSLGTRPMGGGPATRPAPAPK